MAIDIKLGPDNNLVLDDGDLALVTEDEEIAQALKIKMQTIEGESRFDFTLGLPLYDILMKARTSYTTIVSLLKKEILSVPGIERIETFELGVNPNTRQLGIDYSVSTIYGTITDTVIL